MNPLVKAGRLFYGLALAGIGIQHFIFPVFQPLVFPSFPGLPVLRVLTALAGTLLVVCGLLIAFRSEARKISLALAVLFLLVFFFGHLPYQFIVEPNSKIHLGLWTSALKELALAGGAFIIAASYGTAVAGDPKSRTDGLL